MSLIVIVRFVLFCAPEGICLDYWHDIVVSHFFTPGFSLMRGSEFPYIFFRKFWEETEVEFFEEK
jgi:hypothetical protein